MGISANSEAVSGALRELHYGTDFSYILEAGRAFLPVEYKVVRSWGNSSFLPCVRTIYNGKVQICYKSGDFQPLSAVIGSMGMGELAASLCDLASIVGRVRENGFLSCCNIAASSDKIYVEPGTGRIRLVYVPVEASLYPDEKTFEQEIRRELAELVKDPALFHVPQRQRAEQLLSDGSLTLAELCRGMREIAAGGEGAGGEDASASRVQNPESRGMKRQDTGQRDLKRQAPERQDAGSQDSLHRFSSPRSPGKRGRLRLVSLNAPGRVELEVTGDSFLVGKNPAAVDGVFSFNKAISRVHCKIIWDKDHYAIEDMGSSNGTYVNHLRLLPHVPERLADGDIVQLADSEFQVREERI